MKKYTPSHGQESNAADFSGGVDFSDSLSDSGKILNTSTKVPDDLDDLETPKTQKTQKSERRSFTAPLDPELQNGEKTDDSENERPGGFRPPPYANILPYMDTMALPFKEFIAEGSYLSREEAEQNRDTSGDRWQLETWLFARMCKARPEFRGLNANQAVKRINWSLTVFEDLDSAKAEFKKHWRKVLLPYGETPLSVAIQLAKERPLITDGESHKEALLVSVCGWLQRIMGDADIFISRRDVCELLNVNPRVASAFMENLVADGFIRITEKSTAYRATRFRFDMTPYPILTRGD